MWAILLRYIPIQNRHISSVFPFNNPIVSFIVHKKYAEGIGNDFHTYPDCWVALFHYIALQMTDSSVINFRPDLVVPHPILSLIIDGIFLCCTSGHCIHCAYICISWAAEELLLNWESDITCTHRGEKMKKSNIKEPQKYLQEAWSSSTATCEVLCSETNRSLTRGALVLQMLLVFILNTE